MSSRANWSGEVSSRERDASLSGADCHQGNWHGLFPSTSTRRIELLVHQDEYRRRNRVGLLPGSIRHDQKEVFFTDPVRTRRCGLEGLHTWTDEVTGLVLHKTEG